MLLNESIVEEAALERFAERDSFSDVILPSRFGKARFLSTSSDTQMPNLLSGELKVAGST